MKLKQLELLWQHIAKMRELMENHPAGSEDIERVLDELRVEVEKELKELLLVRYLKKMEAEG